MITGAARGQGRAHALRMAEEGADIVAIDGPRPIDWLTYPTGTREDLAETVRLVEGLDRRIVTSWTDVRDFDGLRGTVDDAVAQLGYIDIVVANAGIGPVGRPFWEIPEQEWRDVLDVNLLGVWKTVSAAAPAMIAAQRGGSVIITSSAAGLRAASNIAHYGSAKVALVGLMGTMARELAPHRIRVNVIAPSSVDTPLIMNDATFQLFGAKSGNTDRSSVAGAFQRLNLLPEPWLEASDIAAAAAFLASDDARYITGVVLPVDLGAVLK
jgi:SDR family mycofactocin-dependent oxidoreductase